MDEETPPQDDGIPLIEGWMLGVLFFEDAMAEIARLPPANDEAPAPAEG